MIAADSHATLTRGEVQIMIRNMTSNTPPPASKTYTVREIAGLHDVSEQRVRQVLARSGLDKPGRDWVLTEQQYKYLLTIWTPEKSDN